MKLLYRPEIDGLRALAILAVVIYHAKIHINNIIIFPGGYLGVDIFFVISGFLITSIIFKEIKLKNQFSFSSFYERRIRRILPALFVVIFLVFILSWFILLPSSLVDLSESSIFSIFFTSNFYFHYTGTEYGTDSSLYKPLLHTWSLSVEEQFYLLFPVIIIFIYKYLRDYILSIILITIFFSLVFSHWASITHPSFNFYVLISRVWEILLGSLVAYINFFFKKKYYDSFKYFTLVGIIAIFFSFCFFDKNTLHPSFLTLVPILGVVMIILFSKKEDLITKFLSYKPIVKLGLISYSLYLFHYPIFTFARITDVFDENNISKIFYIFISVIISYISFKFIETPFRKKTFRFSYLLKILIMFSLLIISISIILIHNKGYENRFFTQGNYTISSYQDTLNDRIFETNYNYDNYFNDKNNVLIVGNSHADDLLKVFYFSNYNKNYYFNVVSPVTRKKNLNYQVSYFYDFLINNKAKIDGSDINFLDHLKKQYRKSEIIILATRWRDNDFTHLEKIIEKIKDDGKKVVLFDNALENTQMMNYYHFNRLDYWVYKNKKFPDKDEIKRIEKNLFNDLKKKEELNKKINLISKKTNTLLIERKKVFCDIENKRCRILTPSGHKVYYDYSHLTIEGSQYFGNVFNSDNKIKKIFN